MDYTPDILMERYLIRHCDKKAVIVDVGCGDGRFVKRLFKLGYVNVWGVDPLVYHSPQERHSEALRLAEEFPFRLMRVDEIPFPDDSIDVVLSNQVVEHVENKKAHFQEIRRVLKPGGFALLVIPIKETFWENHVKLPLFHWANLNSPIVQAFYRLLVWIGLGAYPNHAKRMEWLENTFKEYPKHHFFITRRQAIKLLRESGFSVHTLDSEYLEALKIKYRKSIYEWIISIGCSMGLGQLILSQVGVAIKAKKLP
jgi:SAM-dependent methyltransferase